MVARGWTSLQAVRFGHFCFRDRGANNIMSFSFHAYQPELYPTSIRGRAVGFVYSFSRLSAVFNAFIIAFMLGRFGVAGVFAFISASMLVVAVVIGALGPRTRNLALEAISH